MKCWDSAFNAQGSRVIIVVVQVGGVKIYVVAVEALRKKEIGGKTQFTTKIGGKTSLGSSYFVLWNFITKIGGKTSLGSSYFVLWNFIPSEAFDGLLYGKLAVLAPKSPDFRDNFNIHFFAPLLFCLCFGVCFMGLIGHLLHWFDWCICVWTAHHQKWQKEKS